MPPHCAILTAAPLAVPVARSLPPLYAVNITTSHSRSVTPRFVHPRCKLINDNYSPNTLSQPGRSS
uniref:Uncharacterized protein n=1 Tax=Oryza glumipatula TaxID=40148 RepID=A0A0E0B096_9ORYZ